MLCREGDTRPRLQKLPHACGCRRCALRRCAAAACESLKQRRSSPRQLSSDQHFVQMPWQHLDAYGTHNVRPNTLAHARPQVPLPSQQQATLSVAVRVRPLLKADDKKGDRKDIVRVLDKKIVVVLDPDESKVRRQGGLFDTDSQREQRRERLSPAGIRRA